jgi:hypothetical protein
VAAKHDVAAPARRRERVDAISASLYYLGKGMTRISTKNQITLPVSALTEAGLRAGEAVTVEPAGEGELRVRRAAGAYPAGYLDTLDAEDAQR